MARIYTDTNHGSCTKEFEAQIRAHPGLIRGKNPVLLAWLRLRRASISVVNWLGGLTVSNSSRNY